ncbi:MAG TPA: ubiquinol-cytochrome c reductase iron-sulfur subunit [Halococcus sp.]|nr:ubiquinol-cytochrome c reductase iron-sulfur subunit [Halococcus sp.]
MPEDEDTYPEESGRRRFVKGVVGASALGTLGVTGAASINLTTSSTGKGGGTLRYFGIENIAGPAPRSMPQIPIKIDSDGYLKGAWPEVKTKTVRGEEVKVAQMKLGGITYSSEWFQYCGVQTYSGVAPNADQSNFFLSASSGGYDWQGDLEPGAKLNVSDFSDYETWGNGIGKAGIGKPAMATWRSQDLPPSETIPVQVLRSTKIEELAKEAEYPKWVQESTEQGFIAWLDKCTHFCCVPGFKSTAQSTRFGASNDVYCPCHQSVYDPFSPVKEQFTALPRPEDTGSSGSSGGSST